MSTNDLAQLLVGASELWKDNLALTDGTGRSITYAEYFNEANKIAGILAKRFPSFKTACILTNKSTASLCLIQGILAAKAAYVPLNPNYSFEKNTTIFNNFGFDILIVESHFFKEGNYLLKSLGTLELNNTTFFILGQTSRCPNPSWTAPLAYILFTSGSTGAPKGIAISHSSAMYFIDWCSSVFKPFEEDVFSSVAHWCFDLSVLDIFLPIKHGSRLIVLDEDITRNPQLFAKAIQQHSITNIYATPTLFKSLVNYGKLETCDLSSVSKILFAGEVFPAKPLNQLRNHLPGAMFYNLYGPTETNVCLFYELPSGIETGRNQPYPIGKPCLGTKARISGELSEGVLEIAGPGIMTGYYNDADKTELATIVENAVRWYNTGDIVHIDDNGDFNFVGRQDRQIKRRGYRIELDEIENVLENSTDIAACAVSAVNDKEETIITAHIVLKNMEVSLQQIRSYLLSHLESYKLPDKFCTLQALPTTITGKVDYAMLKNM